ncbi:MAG TPA: phosphoglycerate kinase [Candidatus Paceibacterota bacterium]|nr:phosphoglycerate kinase [Candidatus Paceibacterota bacterium]
MLDVTTIAAGMTVFLRTDFDVPVGPDGIITETFRIERQRDMLTALVRAGARVIIGSHITSVSSFERLLPQLQRILNVQMVFCPDFKTKETFLSDAGTVALLENLRSNPGEEDNNEAFAGELVRGCDIYVNNAFAVCHREHASVTSAALIIPSYAGRLIADETANLERVMNAPAEGKIIFMGGAKASTKVPVITNLIAKAERIAVGGRIAIEIPTPVDARISLPVDFADGQLDIGPRTAEAFAALADGAKLIIWNGPMGKFEDDRYLAGTRAIAEAIASSNASSVIGGGDTIAAIAKLGIPLERFGFVSTGGGAMLAFLAGTDMPGLRVLGYVPVP